MSCVMFRLLLLFVILLLPIEQILCRIPDEPSIPNQMLTKLQTTTTSTTAAKTNLSNSIQNGPCFYAGPEYCPSFDNYENNQQIECECKIHPTVHNSVVCCNVTSIENLTSCIPNVPQNHTWTNIHIRNATLDELDVENAVWKMMNSIAITDGSIKRITNVFKKFTSVQCLNISNNNLNEIKVRAFKDLTKLQILDISYNNLSTIPNISTDLKLDIRGNNGMLCKSVMETIDRNINRITFIDPDTSICLSNQTFHWFNSTDSVALPHLFGMKKIQSECPNMCICGVDRMNPYYSLSSASSNTIDVSQVVSPVSQWMFSAKVDCSNLGLIELPEKLPPNTYSLNVSINNITSLSALNANPTYQHLKRLYADDNQISSLIDLEGTNFIEEFEVLFLKRNKLKSLPSYWLQNSLDKNPGGKMLYFEGNKLQCDCNSAKSLKIWLLQRQNHVKDYDLILCENMQRVIDLSEMTMCQSQHVWTDYIYYLITAEIILLVALIMKVSYDYWVFKTAGYLPWPASKMPKLPCDWLCES